uniref:Uncharacterized protein n=1 Tax=Arsenophonus nasoniae TaxID=638 RepID=D2TW70_9GAMM|nr:hypothetical protein ARN_02900 [Arsenophonus nasoniae]
MNICYWGLRKASIIGSVRFKTKIKMTFHLKIIFYFPLDEYFYVPILMKSVVTNGQSINLSQGASLDRFF